METNKLKPREALNKAFLKVKPNRKEIENFKTNLIELIEQTNDTESEEFHKNLISDFLKKTYYDPKHYINTKGKNDLVIGLGIDAPEYGQSCEAADKTMWYGKVATKKLRGLLHGKKRFVGLPT